MLTVFSALCLLVAIGASIEMWRGNRRIAFLSDQPPIREPLPLISIIIAARNEERHIEEALRSVLELDYSNAEIIVVNDRSTDSTGSILERLSAQNPRLKLQTIGTLPDGWLGKNHALWSGSQLASGEYLLFTDADVVYDPSALKRAMFYLQMNQLDHLTITPRVAMPSLALDWFVGYFVAIFTAYFRPWRIRDPKRSEFMGVGAFNLIRKSVYQAVGTHKQIRLRTDDDLMLGKLVKRGGYHQDMLFGTGLISIEWYASFGEAVQGLMKNTFTGLNYSWLRLIAATLANLLFNVWPFVALFATQGPVLVCNALIVILIWFICWDNARFNGVSRWCGIGYPFMSLLFTYIMWRAAVLATVHGGVRWRGTFYSLKELKTNDL